MRNQNYSKSRTLHGDINFKKVHFGIIKQTVEKEMYPLEDGYMPVSAYTLIAWEGLQNNEYEWTKNFIEKYKKMVRPDKVNNAYNISMATYYYRTHDYDMSLKLFSKVKTEDYSDSLTIKNYLLKIYFETGQYEAAQNNVDTFRHFLNSNKLIPDYASIRYISYISFMGRIINSVLKKDSINLINIRNEINKATNLENRLWMIEQLDNLLKT